MVDQVIKLKRNTSNTNAPDTNDIVVGELAIGAVAGKLYLRKSDDSILTFSDDTNVSTTLTIAADSGSNDTVTVGTNTLTFNGTSNQIGTTVSDNAITIALSDDPVIGGTGSIRVPDGTTGQRPGSPAAGMFRYNTTTSKFEGYTDDWGDIGGGGSNTFTRDAFTGDGSDTTFTLSQTVSSENDLIVFIEGVFQDQDAYSLSGTTLTFGTAPANGRGIIVYSVKHTVAGNNLNIDTMTGDGSDTTLSLTISPNDENNTQVFIDGVYQNKSTYSISGSTLTFSTAPPNGSAVECMTFTQTDVNEATYVTANANNSTNETVYPTFVDGATGKQEIETDTGLTYNPSSGVITATQFTGAVSGNASTATEATNVTASANNSTDETVYPTFVDGATGTQGIETDTGLTYNPSSGLLTSTLLAGTLNTAAQANITSLGTLTALTGGTGDLIWDTDTLVVDSSTDRVGIGTTSPSSQFVVAASDGGNGIETQVTTHATNKQFILAYDRANSAYLNMELSALNFGIATNNGTTRLHIDTSGNVGIGTSSPATTLHVLQDSAKIQLESNGSDTGVQLILDGARTSNGTVGDIVFENAGDTVAMIRAERVGGNDDAADMSFYTQVTGGSNAEKMRITSAGDVGIGVSPVTNSRLTVKTQGDGTFPIRVLNSADSDMLFGVYESSDGDGNNGMVYINDGAGNTDVKLSTNGDSYFNGGKVAIGADHADEPLTVRSSAENVNCYLLEIGNDLHASNTKDAWMKYVGGAATTDHSWATGIYSNTFAIKQLGARATAPDSGADRLKLDATGCMQLHSNGSGDTTIKLYEGSTIKWWIQNDTGGSPGSDSFWIGDEENDNGVYVGQDGSSWSGISDERLKRNWTNLENATDKIKTLTKVGTFQRRGKSTGNWSDNREVGLSAQEVEAILPEAVTTGGDIEFASDDKVTGVKGLSYDKLVPLLVKSIQELEARIKTLEG